jgi:hypothetical protein
MNPDSPLRARTSDRVGDGRSKRRTAFGVAAALVLLAIAVVTGVTSGSGSPPAGPSPSVSAAPTDPWAGYAAGWTKLPLPPEVRPGAANVWTGQEVMTWGGAAPPRKHYEPTADGYSFDPRTGTWSPIPSAPVASKYAHGVWTGSRAIFVSGRTTLAYAPATRTWETLPTVPANVGTAVVVWTGAELFVWGGGREGEETNARGAMFDPASRRWRSIVPAPFGLNLASGVWTGREVIVFGSLLNNRNIAPTRTSVGEAYDPSTDRWRKIAASRLSPQATSAVWLGRRLLAWDYEGGWQLYDVADNRWTIKSGTPFQPSECYPDSAAVGNGAFAWYCGQAATFDLASRTWRLLHGGPLKRTIHSSAYHADLKLWRFADLVPAGQVIVLPLTGITLEKNGEACYGCSGASHSLWVYRPG